jgi:hypothetical protein
MPENLREDVLKKPEAGRLSSLLDHSPPWDF